MARAGSSWKSKIFITLLWLNFIALWLRVYRITTITDVTDSVNYLGGLISAYGVVVVWWIFHNIQIYKTKKGRSARVIQPMNTHDSLQRYMSRKVNLHREQEILIDVVGGRKLFLRASGSHEKEAVLASEAQ